jgi:hypothetical protein
LLLIISKHFRNIRISDGFAEKPSGEAILENLFYRLILPKSARANLRNFRLFSIAARLNG